MSKHIHKAEWLSERQILDQVVKLVDEIETVHQAMDEEIAARCDLIATGLITPNNIYLHPFPSSTKRDQLHLFSGTVYCIDAEIAEDNDLVRCAGLFKPAIDSPIYIGSSERHPFLRLYEHSFSKKPLGTYIRAGGIYGGIRFCIFFDKLGDFEALETLMIKRYRPKFNVMDVPKNTHIERLVKLFKRLPPGGSYGRR